MKTYTPKATELEQRWHLMDASGKTLGRLASQVAQLLRGKHRPSFSPHLDMGDHVVVINASQLQVTGKKLRDKVYYRHSGYPGGLKQETLAKLLAEHPTRVLEHAIQGMLPHNRLGRALMRKLRVYAGSEHPHRAQLGARGPKPTEETAAPASGEKRGEES